MASRPEGRRRHWRSIAVVALIVLLVGGSAIGGWQGSAIMLEPDHPHRGAAEVVLGVKTVGGKTTVVLAESAEAARPGSYGLAWDGGAAMLGDVVGHGPGRVERTLLSGTIPPTGQRARMGWTYSGDPKSALGLDFTEIMVPAELGDAPAWHIPGTGPAAATWAITVHGSNATRNDGLRAAATMNRLGLTVLAISYRNVHPE